MRRLLICTLILCLCFSVGLAEVPCVCNEAECICFIQLGDGGQAVEHIQNTLIQQGYLLSSNDASLFDERTLHAILKFQEAHGLPQTGMLDDSTLTLLLWGMLPEELDQANPFSNGNAVWIPTDGGIRRHVNPACSAMYDPRRVSVRNAELFDMLPCGRCNRGGKNE